MSIIEKQSVSIPKSISTEMGVNYKGMLKEGIESISQMAGKKWTNYNPSDPGITILQLLCYSLLDLGYKTSFPVEDLLTGKNGKINTKEGLYTAQEILFSNPVTSNDFRKLLIDRAEEIKNVWMEPLITKGGVQGAYEIRYELTDELKNTWLDATKKEQKTIEQRVTNGLSGLLYQHRNLGDFILRPILLKPVYYALSGEYYLGEYANPEKSVAWILYQLNNYISTYIQFYTYGALKEEGLDVGEIMVGPRLENGFIKDEDLKPKLEVMDLAVMKALLSQNEQLVTFFNFSIQSSGAGPLTIKNDEVPFFNFANVGTTLKNSRIYLGNRLFEDLDQAKVNAYYRSYSQRKPVSSFNFPSQLGPEIPEGKYRDIRKYHSVQNLFPDHFGLDVNRSFEGVPEGRRGQIKQLKAYLMLMEQIIADHQSQLANIGALLSFNPEVSVDERLCQTYFSQGLYDTPGSRFILKAFDNYRQTNEYLSEHPEKTWERFKRDASNVYATALSGLGVRDEVNIERKFRMLSHVLARYGETYSPVDLIQLNPNYGNFSLAGVESISDLLKSFPLYSENMGRSYFEVSEKKRSHFPLHKEPVSLFTGIEYKLGICYQLTSYYQGIIDIVSHGEKGKISNYKKEDSADDIRIYYQKELIMHLPSQVGKSTSYVVHEHLRVLRRMVQHTKGFILLDNQLLLSGIQSNWSIYEGEKPLVFKLRNIREGSPKSQSRVKMSLRQAMTRLALREAAGNKGAHLRLDIKEETKDPQAPKVTSIKTNHPVFDTRVTVFFPSWLPRLKKPDFKAQFKSQLMKEGPIQVGYDVHYLRHKGISHMLKLRTVWFEGIKSLQAGQPIGILPGIAAVRLLLFILGIPFYNQKK